jgi:hypothetical protein
VHDERKHDSHARWATSDKSSMRDDVFLSNLHCPPDKVICYYTNLTLPLMNQTGYEIFEGRSKVRLRGFEENIELIVNELYTFYARLYAVRYS